MTWHPTKPYQISYIVDTGLSFAIIAGYFLIRSYCQWLFLGPCNTAGPNFGAGVSLMIVGALGLGAFRLYRSLTRPLLGIILVFTEGTVIREERGPAGRMVGGRMLGDAAGKLRKWSGQGARIEYLTSRRRPEEIQVVRMVLKENRFPEGLLNYRRPGEEYKDVAERIMPDVLVEDNCASIGGEKEMTYPHIREDLKPRIKSVLVREFGGIDGLPDSVSDLLGR